VEDDQTKIMIFCATQIRAEGTMLDQVRSYLGNNAHLAGGHALAFTGSTKHWCNGEELYYGAFLWVIAICSLRSARIDRDECCYIWYQFIEVPVCHSGRTASENGRRRPTDGKVFLASMRWCLRWIFSWNITYISPKWPRKKKCKTRLVRYSMFFGGLFFLQNATI
jgi:hypothetical protein